MSKSDYTEDNIKTLEWVLHIRKRFVERIYVKFRPAKNQRVHQAYFDTKELAVRSASARGLQLTTKSVARISATKPGWWNDAEGSGKGSLF